MLRSVWSRLATFRRPDGPEPSTLPAVGEEAPERPHPGTGEPRVVAFLRHVGCAFGERMLSDLREAARAFPEIQFVAIAHGDSGAATDWCEELGFTAVHVENAGRDGTADEWCRDPEAENLRVFVDEGRELYAEWGLGLGGAAHLLRPRVVAELVRVNLQGARDRASSGTRWQRAGMFAVDPDGTVRARHVADFAGDLPDFEVAATFLDREPVQTAAEASFSRVTTGDADPLDPPTGDSGEALSVAAPPSEAPEPRSTDRETEPAVTRAVPEPRPLDAREPAITRLDATERAAAEAEGSGADEETDRERVRLGDD